MTGWSSLRLWELELMAATPIPRNSKNPETETGLTIMGKSPQDYPWSMDNEVPRERDHVFYGTRYQQYGGNIRQGKTIVNNACEIERSQNITTGHLRLKQGTARRPSPIAMQP